MTKLDRLRELWKKATPPVWQEGVAGHAGIVSFNGEDVVFVASAQPHNRALIIALHNNAEALLSAVEISKEMMKALKYNGMAPYSLMTALQAALAELEEGT